MKVLFAVDIVHPYKPVAEQMLELLPLKDAELKLLYVKEELPSYEVRVEAMAEFDEDYGHILEEKAQSVLKEIEEFFKPHVAKVASEIVSGPAAYMIETVARDEAMDITVLAAGHHSKVQVFLLGSVSTNVMKHGPNSVLICHADEKPKGKLSKVVIGVDGSAQSKNAVAKAAKQFNLKNAEISLIHVVSVADVLKMISPVEYISFVENNLLLEGETFLADAQEQLSKAGVTNVSCVLKEGDPATEVLNLAKSEKADLVIIGAKGKTAIQHFLLGSVSHRIATHTPCACAVIKQ